MTSAAVAPRIRRIFQSTAFAFGVLLLSSTPTPAAAASVDLGGGFVDHGVAVPISNHRGTVATVDADGRNVVLSWIFDHRGCYALLMVDAETGKHEQFPVPFDNEKKDSPFSSILSSGNKYYSHFGDHFLEFDPVQRKFSFSAKTAPQMAMGMTEDDNGVIWSVTYPKSGVVAFDPKTREFRDFGHVYDQNWNQYQRHVASDDAGWIYFGLGMTATQIVALDPKTSTATPLLPEGERHHGGTAYVYRDKNGKVYGQAHTGDEPWYEIYKGQIKKIGSHTEINPVPIITFHQGLFHKEFPNGDVLEAFDLVNRKLTYTDKETSESKSVSFDYSSEGAIVMGVCASPDGTLTGGTAFPMRNFVFDPKSDKMSDRTAYGQWNTIAALNDKIFVGGYPSGYMLEWEPGKPWVPTDKANPNTNPQFLMQVTPVIHRPHALLPLADESMVIMGGTPEYGYTGGGLLFWDRKATTGTVIKDTDVVPDQSTHALIELPGGKLLGGTTTAPGTGGEKKAKEAELYILDIATKKVLGHGVAIPGVQTYTDFATGPNGLIYGIADNKIFFVYDPAKAAIVKKEDLSSTLGSTVGEQGPRVFVEVDDTLYVLLANGIASVDKTTHNLSMVAKSPEKIKAGGAYLDGRLYFLNESHLLSFDLSRLTTGTATAGGI